MKKLFTLALITVGLSATCSATIDTILVGQPVAQGNPLVYIPETLNVYAGDTVHWVWQDGNHPTSSTNSPASWNTIPMNVNQTFFEWVVPAAGDYPYRCDSHWPQGMTGIIMADPPLAVTPTANLDGDISVFPNPFAERVTIDLGSNSANQVDVLNMNGQVVRTTSVNGSNGQVGLMLGDLARGSYLIRVRNGNETVAVKRVFRK